MAVSSDVSVAQDGGGIVKLHPYLVALVRWCVSCFWGTATVLLHRLMTAPLPQIKASRPSIKPREVSTAHLHPEPKVECQVLRVPADTHNLDVIFVHGLYGSLGNTWRQGDWRSKYNIAPNRVPLRRSSSIPNPCTCSECEEKADKESNSEDSYNISGENDTKYNEYSELKDLDLKDIDEEFYKDIKKLLPNNNVYISDDFYKNKFLNQIEVVDNYESHADFVRDLFKMGDNCDVQNGCVFQDVANKPSVYSAKCDFIDKLNRDFNVSKDRVDADANKDTNLDSKTKNKDTWQYRLRQDEISNNQKGPNQRKPNSNIVIDTKTTNVINCICKKEKETVSNTFKGESVNYDNNENEIDDNKSESIENGTSEKFNKSELTNNKTVIEDFQTKNINNIYKENSFKTGTTNKTDLNNGKIAKSVPKDENSTANDRRVDKDAAANCEAGCGCVCDDCYSECWPRDWIGVDYPDARVISINYTSDPYLWRPLWVKECKRLRLQERAEQMTEQLISMGVGLKPIIWVGHSKGGLFIKQIYCEAYEAHLKLNGGKESKIKNGINNKNKDEENFYVDDKNENENELNEINVIENTLKRDVDFEDREVRKGENESDTNRVDKRLEGDFENCHDEGKKSLIDQEDSSIFPRASLWRNSVGFMFYSVPHLGSPLADIKTPLTARSIELLEISKDCALVVSLQARWLAATLPSHPVVRSLVETCRTLLAVFWLKVVSVDSADPGIGALCGVSVDHREICKPTSRHCLLYTELTNLMRAAINKCKCQ